MAKGSGGGGRSGRSGGGGGPEVMTYEQFANKMGVHDILEEHVALRFPHGITERQQKKISKNAAAKLEQGIKESAAARSAYNEALQSGKVRPPTRMEKLMEAAKGHPDNQSTQSARRILKKRGLSW